MPVRLNFAGERIHISCDKCQAQLMLVTDAYGITEAKTFAEYPEEVASIYCPKCKNPILSNACRSIGVSTDLELAQQCGVAYVKRVVQELLDPQVRKASLMPNNRSDVEQTTSFSIEGVHAEKVQLVQDALNKFDLDLRRDFASFFGDVFNHGRSFEGCIVGQEGEQLLIVGDRESINYVLPADYDKALDAIGKFFRKG